MPKQYINGAFITEKTFNDGGSILKLSIPADKIDALAEQLRLASTDGWTRLVISKLREPKLNANGKITATHSLSVDDWKPTNQPKPQPMSREAVQAGLQEVKQATETQGEVPF